MNKVYGIACMSLVIAMMQAGSAYNLNKITEAIEASAIGQVKTQWRRLDSVIESPSEKKTILESLIKDASKLAEGSKGTVASAAGVSKDYKKVAGSIALFFATVGFGVFYALNNGDPYQVVFDPHVSTSERLKALGVIGAISTGGYLSGKLFRIGLGWEGAEPIVGGGRSKAAIVLSYLEGLLQELNQETRNA